MPKRKSIPVPAPRGRLEVCKALIEAGMRLFASRGPAAVSVRDVASAAGVNHSLVFRHFGNKDGLVRAVFEALFENSGPRDQSIESARDRLLVSVEALTCRDELWRLLTYAMLEGELPVLLSIPSPYMSATLERFRSEQQHGSLRPDIDARLMLAAGMALGLGWRVFQPLIASLAQLDDEDPAKTQNKLLELWKTQITADRPT